MNKIERTLYEITGEGLGQLEKHKAELHAAIDALVAERDALKADAARYRWLREQVWHENKIAVVLRPKDNVQLGSMLPFEHLLDNTIDLAMAKEKMEGNTMILEHCHRAECKQHVDALNAEITSLKLLITVDADIKYTQVMEIARLRELLKNLLDDTQHVEHTDCDDGPCPVRDARAALLEKKQ